MPAYRKRFMPHPSLSAHSRQCPETAALLNCPTLFGDLIRGEIGITGLGQGIEQRLRFALEASALEKEFPADTPGLSPEQGGPNSSQQKGTDSVGMVAIRQETLLAGHDDTRLELTQGLLIPLSQRLDHFVVQYPSATLHRRGGPTDGQTKGLDHFGPFHELPLQKNQRGSISRQFRIHLSRFRDLPCQLRKSRLKSRKPPIDIVDIVGIYLEGAANTDLHISPVGCTAFGDLLNEIDGLGKPRQCDDLVADGFFHVM